MSRSWLHIGSLVLLYVAFATTYNFVVPLYEAPDERAHVGYVDALQRTGSIPALAPDTYVAVGPPLYHALGAGIIEFLGLSSPFIDIPFNQDFPNALSEARPLPPNNFEHTPAENDLPFRGPVLSIHVLRALSTLFGAGTVVFVYLTVRALFPGRSLLAWSAGANTALLPQFAFVGGAVMNDTAAAFFSAASLYAGVRLLQDGAWKWVLVAAASLALGFLTESSTIIPAVVCALAVAFTQRTWRWRFLAVTVLATVPLAVAGWFHIDHLLEYGEIYPGDAVRDVIPQLGPALALDHPFYRGDFQATLARSYWYTGGVTIRVASAMYQFLDVIAGMALAGLIVYAIRSNFSSLQKRGLTLVAVLLALALFEAVWISATISYQPQGRYLFIAQPAIALILALGLIGMFQRDTQRDNLGAFLLPAILFGLNVGILTLTLPAAY